MRYALRKQDKIASALGESYLKHHIIKSLDNYFNKQKNIDIIVFITIEQPKLIRNIRV